MKKIVLVLIAAVSLCALSSCSRTCNCRLYANDNVIDKTVPLDEGQKCSDFNTYTKIGNFESGLKCTPALF